VAENPPHTAKLNGLTSADAAARLKRDGANVLPGSGPRRWWNILFEIVTEPMFVLLIAAAGLYLLLGNLREAVALSISVLVVIVITVLQERRTERTLSRLRDLTATDAHVIRDGNTRSVSASELVVDDVILLHEGERIPADAELLESTTLSVDESLLTGESLAVDKHDTARQLFSGTLVLRGFGTARVTATGARSEIGKIGRSVSVLDVETTPLYRQVRRVTRWIALFGIALCVVIALLYALSRHDVLGGTLAGITVAMSVLPEEFPVVLTVFMAMGAWRIAAHGVLVRRMPAVETIGAATVLAVDKTGTLTENRMQVALLDDLQRPVDLRHAHTQLNDNARKILFTALAASERTAFDPLEVAIHQAAQQYAVAARLSAWQLVYEYDLTPELLAVTHIWKAAEHTALQVMIKGAPETILSLCHADDGTRKIVMMRATTYAQQGLRLLAVAHGAWSDAAMPRSPHAVELTLLGLIGLADPLRDTVPAALAECRSAGIRVLMITGDHAGTAKAIADAAGLDVNGKVLTGTDLDSLDDEQLRLQLRNCNVFARMMPSHKLRLIQALKANGEIVAMTGDGVNDAPALKAAHVGVALGTRSTTVAREAAAMVLVKDDFSSLVAAVRLGRRIYENIRNAISFIIAVHIPIAGMGLLPVLFGWPLLFYPLHVMFLEFVIDPTCSLVFEADGDHARSMQQPPRNSSEKLFSRSTLIQSALRGGVMLLANALIFALALHWLSADVARALGFAATVINTVALIYLSRSAVAAKNGRRNMALWLVSSLALLLLLFVLYVPPVATLFNFASPGMAPLAGTVVICVLSWLISALLLQEPWVMSRSTERTYDDQLRP
jgi:P-type Ca2+ transporter type 2C